MTTNQPSLVELPNADLDVTEVFLPSEELKHSEATDGVRSLKYWWYPTLNLISLIGFIAAIVSFFQQGISVIDLGILGLMFTLIGYSGEAGWHRHFAHKSYKMAQPIRLFMAFFGSMVGEAPILEYVAYHRRHHIFADHLGDPHSPHYDQSQSPFVLLKNIWHSFFAWKYNAKTQNLAIPEQFAKDLLADPQIRLINQYFYGIVLFSFLLPFLLGLMLTQTWHGAWTAFLWGGLFRFFVMTLMGDLLIRAGCHLIGSQSFCDQANSRSRNINFLAIPSLGLSLHNNHHAFPGSAILSLDRGQIDPSGSLIALLEKMGWAWQVKRPSPEQIQAKRLEK